MLTFELLRLDNERASWSTAVDRVYSLLSASEGPYLFPSYFIRATLPRIGGHIAIVRQGQRTVSAGFLFPRGFVRGKRAYTLRLHTVAEDAGIDADEIAARVEATLEAEIALYRPRAKHHYRETHRDVQGLDIGRPNEAEAIRIRHLQQRIWQTCRENLYPYDIHTEAFPTATSLVARKNGCIVGFVFGFYRFGTSLSSLNGRTVGQTELSIESQLLGVVPEFRRRGAGFLLKQQQARQALEENINIIHWTTDPLQRVNGIFNFEKLCAVSFEFFPDHYAFRDGLNRVTASRIGVTWLLDFNTVQRCLDSDVATCVPEVDRFDHTRIISRSNLNQASGQIPIAVEIPADWTSIQRQAPDRARLWRQSTDAIFSHCLARDRYVIRGVAHKAGKWYLIAHPCSFEAVDRDRGYY